MQLPDNTMGSLSEDWLVGTAAGVYRSEDGNTWEQLGAYQFSVTAFSRSGARILTSTGSGLWELSEERWIQRHNETLTEVMDVIDEGDRIVTASAYGLAFGTTLGSGATEWVWRSDALPVNQRFTNTLLKLEPGRYLVGTEGGMLVFAEKDTSAWQTTSLTGTAIRCARRVGDRFLAGTDDGLWSSDDGLAWRQNELSGPVYALASHGSVMLAGTEEGIAVSGDGTSWRCGGLPGTRVGAVAIDRQNESRWFAGGVPGGLWCSEDGGNAWSGYPELQHEIKVISCRGGVG